MVTWVSRVPLLPHMSGGVTQQVGSVSWGAGVTEAGHSRLHAGPHSARFAASANLAQVPMHDSLVGLLQACRQMPSASAPVKLLLQRSLQARVICSRGFCTPFTYIKDNEVQTRVDNKYAKK